MTKDRPESWNRLIDAWPNRAIRFVGIVVVVLTWIGCGGGDGNGSPLVPPGSTASLSESGTPAQDDRVRLVAGSASGDTVTIQVACGETQSADVYGFAFDLVMYTSDIAEYVAGSVDAGDALGTAVLAVAEQKGNRITVGVTRSDQNSDKISGPESIVVRLALRVVNAGTTEIGFEASTGQNQPSVPAALDTNADPIDTISFDTARASVIGT